MISLTYAIILNYDKPALFVFKILYINFWVVNNFFLRLELHFQNVYIYYYFFPKVFYSWVCRYESAPHTQNRSFVVYTLLDLTKLLVTFINVFVKNICYFIPTLALLYLHTFWNSIIELKPSTHICSHQTKWAIAQVLLAWNCTSTSRAFRSSARTHSIQIYPLYSTMTLLKLSAMVPWTPQSATLCSINCRPTVMCFFLCLILKPSKCIVTISYSY